MVTKALYMKYNSSQNYFYCKDINEILMHSRSHNVFIVKDYLTLDD